MATNESVSINSAPIDMADSRTLISIIVPCFNVESYIRDCINSVLMQSFIDYELILVDDGSTDATGTICDEYLLIDSHIKVIHQPNAGVTASRLAGLNRSNGEYVMFIDSDDLLLDEHTLEFCHKTITEDCSIDFVQFPFVAVSNGKYNEKDISKINKTFIGSDEIFKGMFLDTFLKGYLWGKLFKKSVFGNTPFRDGFSMGEDALFYIDNIHNMNKAIIIPQGLYGYVQRSNSGARTWNLETAYQLSVMYLGLFKRALEFKLPQEAVSNISINSFLSIADCRHDKRNKLIAEFANVYNFKSIITTTMDGRSKRWCRIINIVGVLNSFRLYNIVRSLMKQKYSS